MAHALGVLLVGVLAPWGWTSLTGTHLWVLVDAGVLLEGGLLRGFRAAGADRRAVVKWGVSWRVVLSGDGSHLHVRLMRGRWEV